MGSPHVDLNLLVLFEALLRTGSTVRAARHLETTEPEVVRGLDDLRDALGDALFVSRGDQLVPTPRCAAIARRSNRALRLARSLFDPEPFRPIDSRGSVILGMAEPLAAVHAAGIASHLAAEAPGMELVVHSGPMDWRGALRAQRIDLVLGSVPADPDLCRRTVLSDPYVVLMADDHPARSLPWTAEVFAHARHAVSTPPNQAVIDATLASSGLARRVALRATSPLVAALAAVDSDLMVVTSQRLASQLVRHLPLATLPLPMRVDDEVVPLVWHAAQTTDPRHRWIRDLVAHQVEAVVPEGASPRPGSCTDRMSEIIQPISTRK